MHSSWAELPPLTGAQIAAASLTFSKRTGLGFDGFHPRWFEWLSAPLLDALAVFLMTLEAVGFWPQQLETILVAQIPKASGGRRPIGLFPSVVRLWMRVRQLEVARRRAAWHGCASCSPDAPSGSLARRMPHHSLQHTGRSSRRKDLPPAPRCACVCVCVMW